MMTRSIVICLVVSAFSLSAAATGCSDDDNGNGTPSAKGESCARTADCKSGLVCIDDTCVSGPSSGNPDAGEPSGTGGSTGIGGSGTGTGGSPTTTPVALSGKGESCTRRADCASGLACVLQTCTDSGTSTTGTEDGGAPTSLPTLGQRGESCQSVRDCADGLSCIPRPGIAGGLCDQEEYGLTPTGKVCGGDCNTAQDCCELPTGVLVEDPIAGTFTAIASCTDLVQLTLDGDASVCDATPSPAKDPACFYYKTYCDCAATTWACTANACVYAAKCAHDGNVFKGCPTRLRTGVGTGAGVCDTTTDKCGAAATGCTTADDCEGTPVSDDPADNCEKDECTCVSAKCYDCDTKTKVCAPSPACTEDTQCARALGDIRATCASGKCILPCTTDHDCSPSGAAQGAGAFNAQVCGKDGVCVALGCSSDDDCLTGTGLKTFCIDPRPTPPGAIRSAITD
ncbi:MAG TPA: hypothetical protein VH062_21245 [Polyangiaceae bacterium]|jgi:hypothetical protein|nr:hypothetical protein [Polyangiaceae bacterium]